MEARVADVRTGRAEGLVWLLEHPPVYTAGTSARDEELLCPGAAEVVRDAGRGGRWTYHGPGQRVAYVIRDLRPETDLRAHVQRLERWVAAALSRHGVEIGPRDGRIGLWTPAEEKIAAVGVRVRGGVAYHGVAVNIDPDLAAFGGIVPCGLPGYGVTSVAQELGRNSLPIDFCDAALRQSWAEAFGGGLTETQPPPLSA